MGRITRAAIAMLAIASSGVVGLAAGAGAKAPKKIEVVAVAGASRVRAPGCTAKAKFFVHATAVAEVRNNTDEYATGVGVHFVVRDADGKTVLDDKVPYGDVPPKATVYVVTDEYGAKPKHGAGPAATTRATLFHYFEGENRIGGEVEFVKSVSVELDGQRTPLDALAFQFSDLAYRSFPASEDPENCEGGEVTGTITNPSQYTLPDNTVGGPVYIACAFYQGEELIGGFTEDPLFDDTPGAGASVPMRAYTNIFEGLAPSGIRCSTDPAVDLKRIRE